MWNFLFLLTSRNYLKKDKERLHFCQHSAHFLETWPTLLKFTPECSSKRNKNMSTELLRTKCCYQNLLTMTTINSKKNGKKECFPPYLCSPNASRKLKRSDRKVSNVNVGQDKRFYTIIRFTEILPTEAACSDVVPTVTIRKTIRRVELTTRALRRP